MATNEILRFAETNTGTNLLTQAEYASDAQRTTGHQPGIARAQLENKVLRQASLMSSGLAEFIADYQANNVTDSLTPQQVADYLVAAINTVIVVPDYVPAGSVIYVGRSLPPTGYLKANGAAVSRSTYATLFNAIGTTFGAGNGSTTFNLPDLRGVFPRGLDDGRGLDSGRNLGTLQTDAIRNITGTVNVLTDGTANHSRSDSPTGAFKLPPNSNKMDNSSDDRTLNGPYGLSFDASGSVPTASENRPINVALLACIRF
jgi:microcystin-dependent protein